MSVVRHRPMNEDEVDALASYYDDLNADEKRLIDTILKMRAELRNVPRWIPCETRTPEEWEIVWVYDPTRKQSVYLTDWRVGMLGRIKFWMPIRVPKLPEMSL